MDFVMSGFYVWMVAMVICGAVLLKMYYGEIEPLKASKMGGSTSFFDALFDIAGKVFIVMAAWIVGAVALVLFVIALIAKLTA
jgi:hypothetical protein